MYHLNEFDQNISFYSLNQTDYSLGLHPHVTFVRREYTDLPCFEL